MNDTGKTFLAALAGAAVGAGLALLFAPASGKETREKIAHKLDDVKEDLKEKGSKLAHQIKGKKAEPHTTEKA